MSIYGKGIFIWQNSRLFGGNATKIADLVKSGGLTYAIIKVADGRYTYGISGGMDLVPPVVAALKARGIKAWGWQYVYGADPKAEAAKAIERIKGLGLDGFVVNAEGQFKATGMATKARTYMETLRAGVGKLPLGLSTYRYPNVHPAFPFAMFLNYVDLSLPQIYWVGSTNPAQQLQRSYDEYRKIAPWRPFVPTGSAYTQGDWSATPDQVKAFLQKSKDMNLQGANFWELATTQEDGAARWNVIKAFDWPVSAPVADPLAPNPNLPALYIAALNSGDPNKAAALYEKTVGTLTYAGKAYKGRTQILNYYNQLLKKTLAGIKFELLTSSFDGRYYKLQWKGRGREKVFRGRDSFRVNKDNPNLIIEHFADFWVQKGIEDGALVADASDSEPQAEPERPGPIPV
ncbi:MAG: nuclear transport factor 2 family protein [Anaerolineales bacterium]